MTASPEPSRKREAVRVLHRNPLRAWRRSREEREEADRLRREPVYLVSAAGQPNFGDELITRTWLDWLARTVPEREVWLDCIEPGRASHLFRDTHPRLRITNTLWNAAHTSPHADVDTSAERMERLLTNLGSPRIDLGLRDLRGMQSIHLLGGGYMNSIWPENLGIIAAMTLLKREHGVRLVATGQGLLPQDDARVPWLRSHLAQFDLAEARDAQSARLLGIEDGTDDAFLAFTGDRPLVDTGEGLPDAMVLVQGDMYSPQRESELRDAVDAFVAAAGGPSSVGFVEAIPPDDGHFAAAHVEVGARFFPFLHSWDHGLPAREGQAWLTSRFHVHLVAAAAGARGVVLNTRPGYYDVKHRLLHDLGTGWRLWDEETQGRAPTPADATVDPSFPATARECGVRKERVARRIYLPWQEGSGAEKPAQVIQALTRR